MCRFALEGAIDLTEFSEKIQGKIYYNSDTYTISIYGYSNNNNNNNNNDYSSINTMINNGNCNKQLLLFETSIFGCCYIRIKVTECNITGQKDLIIELDPTNPTTVMDNADNDENNIENNFDNDDNEYVNVINNCDSNINIDIFESKDDNMEYDTDSQAPDTITNDNANSSINNSIKSNCNLKKVKKVEQKKKSLYNIQSSLSHNDSTNSMNITTYNNKQNNDAYNNNQISANNKKKIRKIL
jgi:hypothetical protein